MTLGSLIASLKGDRTYDDLAREGGGIPTGKRWHTLTTQPLLAYPDKRTIEAIMEARDLPRVTAVLAIADSLEIAEGRDEPSELVQMLPASAAHLTRKQIRAVRDIIRAMNDTDGDEPGVIG